MQKLIFLLAVASTVPQPAVAQAVSALHQGVRLEVTPRNGKPQTGTLMLLRNDSLFYEPGAAGAHVGSFAFADVRLVRVSRGRSALAGALTKGLIGTGIGMLTGALIASAAWSEESTDFFCGGSRGACAAFGGVIGGPVGLVAGTIYGAAHGNERWETVDLPRRYTDDAGLMKR